MKQLFVLLSIDMSEALVNFDIECWSSDGIRYYF